MVKRKVGERAIILFDSIDLDILKILNTAWGEDRVYEGKGILELAKKLNLRHKNLKPHVTKLMALDLIFAWRGPDGKVKIGTGMTASEQFQPDEITKDDWREINEQRALLKYLNKSQTEQTKLNLLKDMGFDLREKTKTMDYAAELKRLKENTKKRSKSSSEKAL